MCVGLLEPQAARKGFGERSALPLVHSEEHLETVLRGSAHNDVPFVSSVCWGVGWAAVAVTVPTDQNAVETIDLTGAESEASEEEQPATTQPS